MPSAGCSRWTRARSMSWRHGWTSTARSEPAPGWARNRAGQEPTKKRNGAVMNDFGIASSHDGFAVVRFVRRYAASAEGLLSALLFGVVPALRTAKPNVMDTLRAAGRSAALGAAGLRNGVVVVEVALAFVLLIGSGLMFRTFLNIQRVNLGFEPRGLLTFQLLGNIGNTPEEAANFKRQLGEQLNAIPGVHSVTASFPLPLAGGFNPVRWGGAEAQGDNSRFQAADL